MKYRLTIVLAVLCAALPAFAQKNQPLRVFIRASENPAGGESKDKNYPQFLQYWSLLLR